jgi:FkbM family methyltransferase
MSVNLPKPLQHAKSYVKSKPRLFDVLKAASRWLPSTRQTILYRFLSEFSAQQRGRVRFVQVGANDGLRWDPLREFIIRDRWQGVLIEPVPGVFKMLKQNYGYLKDSNLHFENVAISSHSGSLALWTFTDAFLADHSLDEQVILLHKSSTRKVNMVQAAKEWPGPEAAVEQIVVPCMSMNVLINKYFPEGRLELVVIDAEGHEADIVRSMDFNRFDIAALVFESFLLNQATRMELYALLEANGYRIRELGPDTAAIKGDIA